MARVPEVTAELLERVRQLRRELHRHPEPGFAEHRTAARAAGWLRRLGLHVREGVAGTGVVGLLGEVGPVVALRADMDGLPIAEQTGLPYASQTPGWMHACGHDGHVAVLLGAAELLARAGPLPGRVKFILQPAEEEGGGARRLVEAGALADPPVEAVFALHAKPCLPVGSIEVEEVPNAACDAFDAAIVGQGGHAAGPHLALDPLPAACHLVAALHTLVGRRAAPFEKAVVTVGALRAGERRNVIPERAELRGTLRTREPAVRSRLMQAMEALCRKIPEAFGLRAEFSWGESTPRVKNDSRMLERVRRVGRAVLGASAVREGAENSMGGEDFAFFLAEQGGVPGCLFGLGTGGTEGLHSPRFDFGDEALAVGMRMFAGLVLDCLDTREER